MKRVTSNKRAFTLIELLVVVLIIGILAAVAVPQYQKAVEKARLAEAITIGSNLEKAMKVWTLEHGLPGPIENEECKGETVYFLGEGATASLDIDLSSFSQDPDCDTCVSSSYFTYEADCNCGGCSWSASRGDHYQINGGDYGKSGSVYSSFGEKMAPTLTSYGFEIF